MRGVGELERGRAYYARQAWPDARDSLLAADRLSPLAADDLELLATAAYMSGREVEYREVLERAHGAHLAAGDALAAVRCAFWIGATLAQKGEMGRAGGWLGRAQRLLEADDAERVERGYLLLPAVFRQEAAGELESAATTAGEAAAIGERFGDADLFALAAHTRGRLLIGCGHLAQGVNLLDEAMVAVSAGETSPVVCGIVYCGVILACREAHEIRRAQEWTAALSGWCERQPDLVAFTGRCRVHRAEIMQLHGAWPEALQEAQRARERCLEGENPQAAGEACYRQGEIWRLRGELVTAEAAFRDASRYGREPQPGLALLRLAQGRVDAAAAAIRRTLIETAAAGRRIALLPAAVEILLAADAIEEAGAACRELAGFADESPTPMLDALAAGALGAIELTAGAAPSALVALRRAWERWQELEAVYEAARVRVRVAEACRALGDEEAAALELAAARETLERLGAATELARIEAFDRPARGVDDHGLTERELEVLRLVATGASNREIATKLVISEHTVARHVQNIFAKLRVSSRTAASAFAFERDLL
ncbi:MAG: LuxR C-terminal-related transcriptional regulator [Solirubrobacterales bacterium]